MDDASHLHSEPSVTPPRRRSSFNTNNNCNAFFLFLASIGSTVSFLSVLSQLNYYTTLFDSVSFYIGLNLVVFLPLLPISILQAAYDSYFDTLYTIQASFAFRGHIGYALTIVCLLLAPYFHTKSQAALLLTTMLFLGTASGILQGSLRQLATNTTSNRTSNNDTTAVTAGMQASALVVLMMQVLVTKASSSSPYNTIQYFYRAIAVAEGVCWLAFSRVLQQRQQQQPDSFYVSDEDNDDNESAALERPLLSRQSSPSQDEESVHGDDEPSNEQNVDAEQQQQPQVEVSYWSLCQKSLSILVVLLLTIASSMAVASWFNRFGNSSLPQVLFYVRVFGDLLGRPATLLLSTHWKWTAALAIARLLFLPYFFLVALGTLSTRPVCLIAGVGLFAASSGYIATVCYQVGAAGLEHAVNVSKQTKLLNVCFSVSVLVGLFASLVLSRFE